MAPERKAPSTSPIDLVIRSTIAAILRTHVNGDAAVVGVAAEGWSKVPTHSEGKPHDHKAGSLPPHYASAVMTPAISSRTSWTLAPPLIFGAPRRTEHNVVCGKAELGECNRQEYTVFVKFLPGPAKPSVVTGRPLHPGAL